MKIACIFSCQCIMKKTLILVQFYALICAKAPALFPPAFAPSMKFSEKGKCLNTLIK